AHRDREDGVAFSDFARDVEDASQASGRTPFFRSYSDFFIARHLFHFAAERERGPAADMTFRAGRSGRTSGSGRSRRTSGSHHALGATVTAVRRPRQPSFAFLAFRRLRNDADFTALLLAG